MAGIEEAAVKVTRDNRGRIRRRPFSSTAAQPLHPDLFAFTIEADASQLTTIGRVKADGRATRTRAFSL